MQTNPITIIGQIPAKANNYVATGHGIIKNDVVRRYEHHAVLQLRSAYHGMTINEPFTICIDVYQRSMRYDLDNSLKTFLDVLQMAGVIADDNQCMHIMAHKHVDARNPRCTFTIETAMDSLF